MPSNALPGALPGGSTPPAILHVRPAAGRGNKPLAFLRFLGLLLVPAALGGLVAASARAQCRVSELDYLVPASGAAGDHFGCSVSMSDTVAVIGACFDDLGGVDAGAAVVYRDDGGVWNEQATLLAGDAASLDWFGYSVAIDKNVIVVGVPNKVVGSINGAGAAYVFRNSGSGWVQETKLIPGDPGEADYFGTSVAIKGRVIIVGSPYDDVSSPNCGSAYVYRYDDTNWVEEQKLGASDPSARDTFGISVSAAWNVLLVGADGDDDSGEASGSATLFRYDGSQWLEERKFTASNGASLDHYGLAVSLRADVAVVGAPYADPAGSDSGAAYVYRYDGGSWAEEARLVATEAGSGDQFGTSVAVRGTSLLVGAPGQDVLAPESGAAYLFNYDGAVWRETRELVASDAAAGDGFGTTVSVGGDLAIVGADLNDVTGPSSGASYIFSALEQLGLVVQPTTVNPGDTITFTSYFGKLGDPVGLAVTSANGAPMFRFMVISSFAANHRWVLSGVVPSGYSGLNATFEAVGLTRCGMVGESSPVAVLFQ